MSVAAAPTVLPSLVARLSRLATVDVGLRDNVIVT